MMRRKYGTAKRKTNAASENGYSNLETIAFELGYLYADTKAKLNALGNKAGGAISVAELARRMGTLFLSEAGGTLLVDSQHLPEMRGLAAEGHEVGPAKTPVHVRAHADRPLKKKRRISAAGRLAMKKAQKKRWTLWKKKHVPRLKRSKKRAGYSRHPGAWEAIQRVMSSPMTPMEILGQVRKFGIPSYTLKGVYSQLSRHHSEVTHEPKTHKWSLRSEIARAAA